MYDFEVFKYNWLVCIHELKDDIRYEFIDNWIGYRQFMNEHENDVFIGFNSKGYDQYIAKAIIAGATHDIIKDLNDWIISGNQGWQHWFLKGKYWRFNNADIKDDMQIGLSLKAIEGHMGSDIEETEVPFDIDRELTQEELSQVLFYCHHDVSETKKLIHLRRNYLEVKYRLGKKVRLELAESWGMTNAKLTARYLGAERVERYDGRDYVMPQEVDKRYIPQDVLDFFAQIHDKTINDDDLYSLKLDTVIAGCPVRVAWGGVHGSESQVYYKADDEWLIQNDDVQSLYPSVMIQYNFMSRNIKDPQLFIDTYNRRIQAKHEGHIDGITLKTPLNIKSGALENQYNDLYDPLMARSLRITCQLLMIELVVRLKEHVESFHLINFNTDGLMYRVKLKDVGLLDGIMSDWQSEKRITLERDHIKRVWIKDVNNLLAEYTNGKVHTVGGYLNYGHSEKAGFNINNNWIVVAEGIKNYFIHGISPEQTVAEDNNPFHYQYIAKSSRKFKDPHQVTSRGKIPVQNVNRVFASRDKSLGCLFHTSIATGSVNKLSNLPENCILGNRNEVTIEQIDKDWYVSLIWKRINDYTGGRKQLTFL